MDYGKQRARELFAMEAGDMGSVGVRDPTPLCVIVWAMTQLVQNWAEVPQPRAIAIAGIDFKQPLVYRLSPRNNDVSEYGDARRLRSRTRRVACLPY